EDVPLPRRRRDREAARDCEGEGEGDQEVKLARTLALASFPTLFPACGSETHQDLRQWMAEQGKGARGKLDPLPQIKPYDPFAYNAFDLPDPFKPRKIEPTNGE